jgi:hypothetical protein
MSRQNVASAVSIFTSSSSSSSSSICHRAGPVVGPFQSVFSLQGYIMELEYLSTVIGSGLEKQENVVQLSTEAKDFPVSKVLRPAVRYPPFQPSA